MAAGVVEFFLSVAFFLLIPPILIAAFRRVGILVLLPFTLWCLLSLVFCSILLGVSGGGLLAVILSLNPYLIAFKIKGRWREIIKADLDKAIEQGKDPWLS